MEEIFLTIYESMIYGKQKIMDLCMDRFKLFL